MNDPAYARLKRQLIETTGLAYYLNQEEDLAGRVAGRLAALRLNDLSAYLDRLGDGKAGEAEWDTLVAELTVGETFFFRYREQFDALCNRMLPEVIERNRQHRRLRIWSAGCATGAEPYSIAILLKRKLAHLVDGWDVTILGTDINREFLARAQRGEFADSAFRSSSDDMIEPCFSRAGKLWTIKPEFRQGVSFQYHNLVQHPFPSLLNGLAAFDLILCRNVMIYFHRDVVRRIIGQFYDCLVEGGWFLVGHAEPDMELFRSFRAVNVPGAVLYQKSKSPPLAEPASALVGPIERSGLTTRATPPARTSAIPVSTEDFGSNRQPMISPRQRKPAKWPTTVSERLTDVRAKADRALWQEAVRCCDELIAIDGLNPSVHFYHALVLEQIGRHAETEQALRRTLYLDRQFVLAHYHLGLLLQKRGDATGAMRSFRNTIKLLNQMDDTQAFTDADGLTVGALKRWTQTHLEVLCRS